MDCADGGRASCGCPQCQRKLDHLDEAAATFRPRVSAAGVIPARGYGVPADAIDG